MTHDITSRKMAKALLLAVVLLVAAAAVGVAGASTETAEELSIEQENITSDETADFELGDELAVDLVEGQPAFVAFGGEFEILVDVRNLEALTVEATDETTVDDGDLTLSVAGQEAALGEPIEFEEPVDGLTTVTVDIADAEFEEGDLVGLEHTFEGEGESVTAETGPTELTEELAPPEYEVTNLTAPENLVLGDAVPVEFDITNVGQQTPEEYGYEFFATDGETEIGLPPTDLNLAPLETQTVSLAVGGIESFYEAGEVIEHGVRAGEIPDLADDTATADLALQAPGTQFNVAGVDAPSEVDPGATIDVTATVDSVGEMGDVQDVVFAFEGETVDTEPDVELDGFTLQDGLDSATVSFEGIEVPEEAGYYEHSVSTDDDTASLPIAVGVEFDELTVVSSEDLLEEGVATLSLFEDDLPLRWGLPEVVDAADVDEGVVDDTDVFLFHDFGASAGDIIPDVEDDPTTGAIYLDQWSLESPILPPSIDPIPDRSVQTGDPADTDQADSLGGAAPPVSYAIQDAEHPLFDGIPDEEVLVHEGASADITWFSGASGETLAESVDDSGTLGGPAVTVDPDSGSVLLSSIGVTPFVDAEEFSPEVGQILANAVEVAEPEDPEGAFFEVSDLSAPGEADPGATIDVSATITNTGVSAGTQDVDFVFDGDVVDTEPDVSLDVDDDTTVEFTDVELPADAGAYEHGVFTDDDSQTATIVVGDLTVLTVVQSGEENYGAATLDLFEDALPSEFETQVVDAPQVDDGVVAETSVFVFHDFGLLDEESDQPRSEKGSPAVGTSALGGESADLIETVEADDSTAAVYLDQWGGDSDAIPDRSEVTGDPAETEQDAFGDAPVEYVIEQEHPIFDGIAGPGESVDIHTGGSTDFTFFEGADGETLATVQEQSGTGGPAVAVDPASGSVLLSSIAVVEFVGPEDYTDEAGEILANAVEAAQEGPPEEPFFAVSDLDAPAEVAPGEEIDITATITNEGEAAGTQDVVFEFEGEEVATEPDVSLDPGQDTVVEFDNIAVPEEPGSYEHGVVTDDDSQTAEIVVLDDESTLVTVVGSDSPDAGPATAELFADELPEEFAVSYTDIFQVDDEVIGNTDVFVLYNPNVGGGADGEELVETVENDTTTGAVYLDQWGGLDANGIPDRSSVTGDPEETDQEDFGGTPVEYAVQADHPIFDGVAGPGEAVEIHTGGANEEISWFTGASGETLAEVSDGSGNGGPAVAVDPDSESVLLSSIAVSAFVEASDYTEAANQTLANAVEFAVPETDGTAETVDGLRRGGVERAGGEQLTLVDEERRVAGDIDDGEETLLIGVERDIDQAAFAADAVDESMLQADTDATLGPVAETIDALPAAEVRNQYWVGNILSVTVDTSVHDVETLADIEGVIGVSPNTEFELPTPAEESGAGIDQAHGFTYGLEQIDVPNFEETFGVSGEGATVAIIDDGISNPEEGHPDLEFAIEAVAVDGEVTTGTLGAPGEHGEHVAGTATGAADPAGDVPRYGVAPNADLIKINTFEGDALPEDSVAAVQFSAEEGADVASMSLGFPPQSENSVLELLMEQQMQDANALGTSVIGSAGNEGAGDAGGSATSPGAEFTGFSIGASNEERTIAGFSSGAIVNPFSVDYVDAGGGTEYPAYYPRSYVKPDVSAPGVGVLSSGPLGGDIGDPAASYSLSSGTSMAAPHVAGAVALVQSATEADLDPKLVETALAETAEKPDNDFPSLHSRDIRYGTGIINVTAATEALVDGTLVVEGEVTDSEGEPIVGASVAGDDGALTSTDEDGSYTLYTTSDVVEVTADEFGYTAETQTVPSDGTDVTVVESDSFPEPGQGEETLAIFEEFLPSAFQPSVIEVQDVDETVIEETDVFVFHDFGLELEDEEIAAIMTGVEDDPATNAVYLEQRISSNAISERSNILEDPDESPLNSANEETPVEFDIEAEHPLFEGVAGPGETVEIHSGGDGGFSWFEGADGDTLAQVGDQVEQGGPAAAVDPDSGAVLLASIATTELTGQPSIVADDYTEAAGQILANAVEFADQEPVDEPEIALSNLSIAGQGDSATILESSEDVTVDVTSVDGAGTVETTLTIDDKVETETVDLADGETETVTFEDVTADITPDQYDVTVSALDQEISGNLMVSVDATGDGDPATDTTGDGLLNDLTGDGEFTILDVQALFDNLDNPAVQDNVELFDFAENDRVSVFDVQALFTDLE